MVNKGNQTMNNDTDQIINGRAATIAWLVLVSIIVVVAAIGIVCEHALTATAVLAATGTCLGLTAAFATLKRRSKTASSLAITAALSAVAGLLVRETQTLHDFVTNWDAKTVIFVVVPSIAILLAIIVLRYNRENHEPRGRRDPTSPGTTTNDKEPNG